jgi:hypothetical protein
MTTILLSMRPWPWTIWTSCHLHYPVSHPIDLPDDDEDLAGNSVPESPSRRCFAVLPEDAAMT